MANVLPPNTRKRFESEYRMRLFVVILFFFLMSAVFGSILLIPSYIISKSRQDSVTSQRELLKKTIVVREQDVSVGDLVVAKQKLNELARSQDQTLQTEIIETVASNIDSDIIVSAFYFKRGEKGGDLRITGRSTTRSGLLAFSERLKKEELFSSVDLPVSSLARDSDIVFSMTLSGDF